MVKQCPQCGLPGVPLTRGKPSPAALAASEDGRLSLGGCRVAPGQPNWRCPSDHEWRDEDMPAWSAAVEEAITPYR
ncbi:hypothetical protein [Actinoplanes palleronii]|uniref:Uncharacterized protein n=1 Tax=Actinoplanes palleronii TaxID=113570 RepID=A0ABQ4BCC6_9ACTN|nr:hypothetical protein [Actinoplanes palleronii]GIE68313.1 hypothetical protein Apa02nite_044210 [Actinoplanes palleronii]